MTQDVSALHARMLTLDTHLDTAIHFRRAGWSFGERHDLDTDVAQLDLPRMDGNLSGGFFVIYTPQGPLTVSGHSAALAEARAISDDIDAMLAAFPDRIGLALTAQDARRLHAQGRRIAFKGIENSYFLGSDLAVLEEFHRKGVRLAGPVHSKANQLGDSATDAPLWHGLSPLGRDWVAQMNRLGIAIDASHAADATLDQLLGLSSAPLVLSHSGSRTTYDTHRNIDDGRLRALAEAGGVIGFSTIYLSEFRAGPARLELFRLHGGIGELTDGEQVELAQRWNALDRSEPMWDAGIDEYIHSLLHVIDVVGVDHVCFGADWDGGGGIQGLRDVTDLPRVTERLFGCGFGAADIEKLWSGNLLRVLDTVQGKA